MYCYNEALYVCFFTVYAGCCCHLCSPMLGQGLSPDLEKSKLLLLKMQSIMEPTSLSSSLCSYTWLCTLSGSSHGNSNATHFKNN